MKRIPDWVVIVVFVLVVAITNLIQGYTIIAAIERATRASVCIDLAKLNPQVGPAGAAQACGLEE